MTISRLLFVILFLFTSNLKTSLIIADNEPFKVDLTCLKRSSFIYSFRSYMLTDKEMDMFGYLNTDIDIVFGESVTKIYSSQFGVAMDKIFEVYPMSKYTLYVNDTKFNLIMIEWDSMVNKIHYIKSRLFIYINEEFKIYRIVYNNPNSK